MNLKILILNKNIIKLDNFSQKEVMPIQLNFKMNCKVRIKLIIFKNSD